MKFDQAAQVLIFLQGTSLRKAKLAILKQQGIKAAWKYSGPCFKAPEGGALFSAVGSHTVNVLVQLPDGTTEFEYVYPLSVVARIRILTKEQA